MKTEREIIMQCLSYFVKQNFFEGMEEREDEDDDEEEDDSSSEEYAEEDEENENQSSDQEDDKGRSKAEHTSTTSAE